MSTIFDLSYLELLEIVQKIGAKENDDENENRRPKQYTLEQLRLKVTEWLLLNNLTTLHRFEKSEENPSGFSRNSWIIPKNGECQSCKDFKNRHKYTPPDPDFDFEVEILEKFSEKNFRKMSSKKAGDKKKRLHFKYYESPQSCFRAFSRICLDFLKCF